VGCGTILLPWAAYALDPAKSLAQFNCRNWTHQDGFPANGINAILQSGDGYLWFGTQKGLVRFDGSAFTVFALPANPQFRRQSISSLAPAPDGGLWFGIINSAFGHLDGRNQFTPAAPDPWVNPTMNVIALLETRRGELWVGADNGVAKFETGKTSAAFVSDQAGSITALCEGPGGRVWLGTSERGLFYCDGNQLTPFPDDSLKGSSIRALAVDAAGQIWVGTTAGLRCFTADFKPKKVPAAYTEVKALLVDRWGVVWVGTTGTGLSRYQYGQFTSLRTKEGLVGDHVTALWEDREGSLWVGTREGLSQLTDVKLPIVSAAEGLLGGLVHGVAKASAGGLWAATSTGLSHVNGRQVNNLSAEAGFSSTYLKRVLEASNGDLYLINGSKEVEILSDGKVVAKHSNGNWPTALAEDAEGVVVSFGGELFRINRERFTPLVFKTGQAPPLYWVRDLFTARDGSLLVASVNGVTRIKEGEFDHWSAENGLSDSSAHSVFEDAEGTIWAGLATGIARIRNGQIRNITRTNGLFENYVFAMALDDHGWMWVNSSSGIFRVRRQSLNDFADGRKDGIECVAYDGLDAVKTTDTTEVEYSVCKTTDGRIWFPSPQGVIVIDPANLLTNQVPPPVQIQQARVNGVERLTPHPETVRPGKGEVEIRYVALSYLAPQQIRYRYQLEGYDADWISADGRRSAFYTNLKPGKYQFHVQACNADGIWNTSGDRFEFNLPPHFYQTASFQFLAGLGVIAGVLGLYAWRVRQLQRKERQLHEANELLETNIRKRTAELAEQRNLLRTLIDHLPDSIFVKDAHNRVVLDNLAHAQALGAADPAAVVGKTDFDFLPRELADKFFTDEQNLLQTGTVFNGEEAGLNVQTGQPQWLRTTKVPLRDQDGRIIGLAGINRDITERKQWEAKLASLHQQLIEASRQAGMAEVATSVLHNVGNVLNSVNISASVVEDRIRSSVADRLEKIVSLLQKHETNLVPFLTQNEHGKRLIDYMKAIVEHLAAEKTEVLLEIGCLTRNIEHIKEIVAMQQAYARVSGVREIIHPSELVEISLRMHDAAYARHAIEVRRDFADVPAINVDRHKTIQILVNLLQNAKRACEDSDPAHRKVVVRVNRAGTDRIKIEVTDNGVGIPPENLTRIFSHGFTTRKDGHGFGLHSGALAAKELGGSLLAASAGVGQGATFTLELPIGSNLESIPQPDNAVTTGERRELAIP
jgi:PAS domain S-box-containing protein